MVGKAIKNITIIKDIALITLRNTPADMKFIIRVFDAIAKKDINVDMISQTAPSDGKVDISFTVPEEFLDETFDILTTLRKNNPEIKTDVIGANCKIMICGEPLRFTPGIAATVFALISGLNIDTRVITTSETEISLLVPKSQYNIAAEVFERELGLKIQQ
jgi:aspartate kinase